MTTPFWLARELSRSVLRATGPFEVINPEKCLEEGGAILAANHASFLDPPIVACAYERQISFLARETLFRGLGGWLYPKLSAFPINRDAADLKSIKSILRLLRGGNRILMFPEGTRTLDGKLQSAKPGLGMIVARSKVPVQPIRIEGSFESWPRGQKYRQHPISVIIGDPIEFDPGSTDNSREGYQEVADRIMRAIAELKRPEAGGDVREPSD